MELRWVAVAACFIASVVLAAMRREGWGWFLFVAFLMLPAAAGA